MAPLISLRPLLFLMLFFLFPHANEDAVYELFGKRFHYSCKVEYIKMLKVIVLYVLKY